MAPKHRCLPEDVLFTGTSTRVEIRAFFRACRFAGALPFLPGHSFQASYVIERTPADKETGRISLILYSRDSEKLAFGEILPKCTLGKPFSARCEHFVRKRAQKPRPAVQISRILPEKHGIPPRAYISARFRHSSTERNVQPSKDGFCWHRCFSSTASTGSPPHVPSARRLLR